MPTTSSLIDRPPPVAPVPSSKEQLVLTAERRFALHGIDGVSLRQIGVDAGMANNSAVQYHFGSKDGLVRAILAYRVPQLIERRRALSAGMPVNDLRAALDAHLLPVVAMGEDPDCYYLMFLEQLMRHGIGAHPFDALPAAYQRTQRDFVARVSGMLEKLPKQLRPVRINQASSVCLHAAADRQRARHFGSPTLPYALYVSELFSSLVAMLRQPVSRETLAALADAPARLATGSVAL